VENGSDQIKVAFLLLCHGPVKTITDLLSIPYFMDNDNLKVYIHYDNSMPQAAAAELREYAGNRSNLKFLEDRIVCKWGEFSLVDATLKMMNEALNDPKFEPDYCYLFSAACFPIKPFHQLQELLYENQGNEYIQANDVRYVKWIAGGWDKERYQYYFPFNYYSQRWWFQKSNDFQEKYKVKRKNPLDINMYFGSQWFCLTRSTCQKILEVVSDKKVRSFFRWSWIPDEFAIQSLTVHLAGFDHVANKNLTYFQFNSFGRPLIFYDDHKKFVTNLPYFFARKFSNHALELKEYLIKQTSPSNEAALEIPEKKIGVIPQNFEIFKKLYVSNSKETKLGRIRDVWNDGIEHNKKPYFILTGPSKYLVRYLLDKARKLDSYVYYDYLFNRMSLNPTANGDVYNGISSEDIVRRDYDPPSFLYQIIHSSDKPICFALDPENDPDHIREVIRWDSNAHIIIVEPIWNNNLERAMSYLSVDQALALSDLDPLDAIKSLELVHQGKRKYYWVDTLNSGDYNAHISWLEDSEDLTIPFELKKLRLKSVSEDYTPKEIRFLYQRLKTKINIEEFNLSL